MRKTLALALVLTLSGVARAEPSAQNRAIAEALFQEANKLAHDGELDAACKKFEASYALDPTLGTKLHSAACYQALGRTASAWAAYNEAASMAANAGDKRREKLARARIKKLEKGLPKLIIEVTEGIDGLRVEIDGHVLGSAGLGTAFPIDPGTHEISVSAKERQPWSTTVSVTEGSSTETVHVPSLETVAKPEPTPAPDAPATADTSADVTSDGSGQRTTGYVVGGVGVVALAAGGYFGLRAKSQASDADAHCDGKYCDPTGLAGHDDARTSATISTVGFGVGLAAIATGVVLILTAKPERERAAWVSPYAQPTGGGVALGGTF